MAEPIIYQAVVLVGNEDGDWGENLRRPAHPHEVVPALVKIIEDLQERLVTLERWRERASR